jgi:putative acyl-CoA dehydrogenase
MTEAVARVLQAVELARHSTTEVLDIFLATRSPGVSGAWGSHYGTLAATVTQAAAQKVMRRAMVTG